MKKILYLTFYFEPDLCAGSFRNSPLVHELAHQVKEVAEIDVITTLPNRYSSFDADAPQFEERESYNVHRIVIPRHRSGMQDQIRSFSTYFKQVKRIISGTRYDMVVASSSRLFTAYLGYTIAKSQRIPLYLDIRDIFTDTMNDILKNPIIKLAIMPLLNQIERRVFNYAAHINLISEGFKPYFEKYSKPRYSTFPNGIDPEFIELPRSSPRSAEHKTIVYAGNIGEGQGLHIIVPQAAKKLGDRYKFVIIGDGGAKQKLVEAIQAAGVSNVEMRGPVKRVDLLAVYHEADFLFLHLNDYDAFKKVLPSKIFELGAYDKPVIAGVAGYANEFIRKHVENRILFLPGDVDDFVKQMHNYEYRNIVRHEFIERFQRKSVNQQLATSIKSYL